MNSPLKSVIVSHPAKQHAYQVALALQRARSLRQLITGVYSKLDGYPRTLARCLPTGVHQWALRALNRRRLVEPDYRLATGEHGG